VQGFTKNTSIAKCDWNEPTAETVFMLKDRRDEVRLTNVHARLSHEKESQTNFEWQKATAEAVVKLTKSFSIRK